MDILVVSDLLTTTHYTAEILPLYVFVLKCENFSKINSTTEYAF